MLKNTWYYYIFSITPMVVLSYFAMTHQVPATLFCICLFIYLAIYRTVLDTLRLIHKGILEKKNFWKLLLPFSRVTYWKEIYFP